MAAALPFLPAAAGIAGSLIKGKKTKFATQQTPEQMALVRYLTQMGQQNMGQGAANKQPTYDAMNMIARMFGGGMGQYGQRQAGPTPTPNPMMASQVPSYAQGGIAWQPQLAQLGERGPEAVVPLQNMFGQMRQPGMVGQATAQQGMAPGMQNMMGQMRQPGMMGQPGQGNPQMQALLAQLMRRRAGGGMGNQSVNVPYGA